MHTDVRAQLLHSPVGCQWCSTGDCVGPRPPAGQPLCGRHVLLAYGGAACRVPFVHHTRATNCMFACMLLRCMCTCMSMRAVSLCACMLVSVLGAHAEPSDAHTRVDVHTRRCADTHADLHTRAHRSYCAHACTRRHPQWHIHACVHVRNHYVETSRRLGYSWQTTLLW